MEKNVDIVVIGAGLTGLTTAFYLKKAGLDFLVLEKQKQPGGVIQSDSQKGYIYEKGPNTGVVGSPEAAELFDEVKDLCTLELASDRAKKRYILKNGKWHALPSGLSSAVSTPLFAFKDKIRVLFEPFRKKGNDPDENLADFVVRRLGQSFLDYAIDPFIMGVYAGDPKKIVLRHALPKLYNLEQNYGSLIGGSVKKMFEKKDERQKKATRKVFSTKGGLSSLTNALYDKSGKENFWLESDKIKIEKKSEGFEITGKTQNESFRINTNKLITTVGAYELPEMLSFIDPISLKNISELHYTKVVEIVLGFDKWEGIPLDGFGGLIPFKENRDILGVLFISTLFEGRAPEGGAQITLFMGGVRKESLVNLSDEEIKKIVEFEVMDLMGLKSFNPQIFEINRHYHAIPQYGIESELRFETILKLQKEFPGLILGGNQRNGIGMSDRIKQGRELAESVILK